MESPRVYTLVLFAENHPGLLNLVTQVVARRQLNIRSITVSASELEGIHRLTIEVAAQPATIDKVVKLLEKIIDVFKVLCLEENHVVQQEIALYKVSTAALGEDGAMEEIVRANAARILTVEPGFLVIEKTGRWEENQRLLEELRPFGLQDYACSGRVAVAKPLEKLETFIRP